MDIEGGEAEVLFDLINSGAVEQVDNIHIDWHGTNLLPGHQDYYDLIDFVPGGDEIAKFLREKLKIFYQMKAQKYIYDRKTEIVETDDESFGDFKHDFPIC